MGAWIETELQQGATCQGRVAPYVGAWIETLKEKLQIYRTPVAPYVGAWIETFDASGVGQAYFCLLYTSPSPRDA